MRRGDDLSFKGRGDVNFRQPDQESWGKNQIMP